MLSSLDVNMEVRHDKSQAVARVSVSLYKHHLRRDWKCREIRMISKASSGEKRCWGKKEKDTHQRSWQCACHCHPESFFPIKHIYWSIEEQFVSPHRVSSPFISVCIRRDTCEDDFESSSRAVFVCLLLFFRSGLLLLDSLQSFCCQREISRSFVSFQALLSLHKLMLELRKEKNPSRLPLKARFIQSLNSSGCDSYLFSLFLYCFFLFLAYECSSCMFVLSNE